MSKAKAATPAEVRTWGRSQPQFAGLVSLETGKQGRVNGDVAKAYNAAHKGKSVYSDKVKVEKVTTLPIPAVDSKGRFSIRNRTVPAPLAREAAIALGYGARGRLTSEAQSATGAALAFLV